MFAVSIVIPVHIFEKVIQDILISEAPEAICICSAHVPARVATEELEQAPYVQTIISFPKDHELLIVRVSFVHVSQHFSKI